MDQAAATAQRRINQLITQMQDEAEDLLRAVVDLLEEGDLETGGLLLELAGWLLDWSGQLNCIDLLE